MTKTIFVTMFVVLMAISFASCGKSEPTIVGSWNYQGFVYTFNEDKTGTYSLLGDTEMQFTYEMTPDTLKILFKDNTSPMNVAYKLTATGLTITDYFGKEIPYVKE